MIELMNKTKEFGVMRIRNHWAREEIDRDAREYCLEQMEGVDVYATEDIAKPKDGELNSATKFGKMWIERYPFMCVIIYDDCSDHAYVHSDHVPQLVAMNQRADIVAKKQLRSDLRGCNGRSFNEQCNRDVTFTVQDGVDIVKYMVKVRLDVRACACACACACARSSCVRTKPKRGLLELTQHRALPWSPPPPLHRSLMGSEVCPTGWLL